MPRLSRLLKTGLLGLMMTGFFTSAFPAYAISPDEEIHKMWNENFISNLGHLTTFFVVVLLIFMFVIINRKLQKIVQKRTNELQVSKSRLQSTNSMLHELAFYDVLTNLPNRTLFDQKLNDAIVEFKKDNKYFSVMYIDLDNFKYTNNTFGHKYGDKILKEVAARLNAINTYQYFLGRLGGDEFAILVYNDIDEKQIRNKADEIISIINKPFLIGKYEVNLSASIGIVFCKEKNVTCETIMKDADIAMYKAKESGKNRYILFDKKMNKEISERLMMSNALIHAIENHELTVHYQPIYNVTGPRIIAFEALLRWNHPFFSKFPPERFIKLSEEIGIIHDIGRWVIKESFKFAEKINRNRNEKIIVTINISPLQMSLDNFIDTIDRIIKEAKIDYSLIGLEITETTLINSFDKCMNILSELKKRGMKILLDDFGMGYSSLNYLWRLPISTVKIDKSFINNITGNHKARQLTGSIIELSHKLDLTTVAEGVETDEQLSLLTHLGCTAIQGFLFSEAIPEKKAIKLIKDPVSPNSKNHSSPFILSQ